MIVKKSQAQTTVREHLRGGAGEVKQKTLLTSEECCVPNLRSYSIQTIAKGATIGFHVHENETEIYFVLKGRAGIDDNGKRAILEEGDSIVTRSGEGHAVANAGDGDLILLSVIITN